METLENAVLLPGGQTPLLDLLQDAIILCDLQGSIIYWNRGAEKLLGWTSGEALGKHADTLLKTQSPQSPEAIQAEVLRTGQWEGELVHFGRDGAPVEMASRRILWSANRGDPMAGGPSADATPAIVEIATDVTERRQAERFRQLLTEAGPTLSAALDASTRLTNIAQVLVPLLADWCVVHITAEDHAIKPVAVVHADPEKRAIANGLLRWEPPDPDAPPGAAQVLRTGQPKLYTKATDDSVYAIARDAEQIQLVRALGVKSAMIVPLLTRGHTLGTITLVVSAESGRQYTEADLILAEELARRAALAVDNARLYAKSQELNAELEERVAERTAELQEAVTQLKDSRLQLLLLSRHDEIWREEVRTRIAREIHDQLGQSLTGLKMDLSWLQKHLGASDSERAQKYRDMSSLVDSTIRDVRRIASDLRPIMLDDLGLVAAAEWQLQEFEKRSGIRCVFTSTLDEVPLDPEGTIVLFRILQETLTNVARHAGATRIDVSLDEVEGSVRLRVHDNGRGITLGEAGGAGSFGLLGMRERVKLRSGTFAIHGAPGMGTTAEITLPASKG